jgi:hypothetical protein
MPNNEELPREECMEADRVVEAQVRRVPPSLLVGLALGSMALSAAFAVAGKRKVANFIGQWVPSLLILATLDRLMQSESGSRVRGSSRTALPNGVVGSSAGAGVGSNVGGTAASTRTPGL